MQKVTFTIQQRTAVILLTRGKYALVDADDAERISRHRWCLWGTYAARYSCDNGRRGRVTMHNEVMGTKPGALDHVNRNRLDNRKANLRSCTGSQNQANRDCRANSSGFHGVTTDRGMWKGHVEYMDRHINVGRFVSAEEAARARDAVALYIFGEFAHLNFPDVEATPPPAADPGRRLAKLREPATCDGCGKTFTVAGIGQHRAACLRQGTAVPCSPDLPPVDRHLSPLRED